MGVARICAMLIWKTLIFSLQASSQGDSVDAIFVFDFIKVRANITSSLVSINIQSNLFNHEIHAR